MAPLVGPGLELLRRYRRRSQYCHCAINDNEALLRDRLPAYPLSVGGVSAALGGRRLPSPQFAHPELECRRGSSEHRAHHEVDRSPLVAMVEIVTKPEVDEVDEDHQREVLRESPT